MQSGHSLGEEVILMLSNLGATDPKRAISKNLLSSSQLLRDKLLDPELEQLERDGYLKNEDGKLYLTRAGLLRAMSRYS
jgi:hypothetical protein